MRLKTRFFARKKQLEVDHWPGNNAQMRVIEQMNNSGLPFATWQVLRRGAIKT